MTLHEFYKIVDAEGAKAQEKVDEYVTLAKLAGVPDAEYQKDSVYISLAKTSEKYRFTKNLVMSHLKETGGTSFFKRK